ncbi:MAG: 2-hydroxyacid dehydrogenase [Oscillospiraceae bacterium]|nr:2-hydroxyacid dehydrogenase [Oscillospiraceae bacterium]
MEQIAFFDAKPYDKEWFDRINKDFEIRYYEGRLRPENARLAEGCKAVCAFVNDVVNAKTIEILSKLGTEVILMRCAGYNNVALNAAKDKLKVLTVPAYSPYAVAEHAMGLILALNRKIPKAYIRTRDFNFSLVGLTGFDLHGKTAGIIGTGRIGKVFIDICRGFGMEIIAHDPNPQDIEGVQFVEKEELFKRSDIISLHCPLTRETRYIIDDAAIALMKKSALIVNTSRGQLIDTEALLSALNEKRIGGAALDVYEEESGLFFEDNSDKIVTDEVISLLVSRPNVIITSHQAFLTEEALHNIAEVTLQNFKDYLDGKELENEVKAKDS